MSGLRHFRIEYDTDNLAWLHMDVAGSSTNVLSAEVLDELSRCLDDVSAKAPRGLIILSDKGNGFAAGADVAEFTRIANEDEALHHIERGQRCFDKLEQLPFPTLALIHGFCMGGGTELALACTCRLARDEAKCIIGLPEIRLGIHPGFGGTVRSIALLGVLKAMDMMLTGRAIKARQARKWGLVDDVVPERHMLAAARQFMRKQPDRRRTGVIDRVLCSRPVRPLVGRMLQLRTGKKAPRKHYPAPYALIDLWVRHGSDRHDMMMSEARSVARLINSKTASNLIRVFFLQEKLKKLGRVVTDNSQHIHVIGAGIMGGDIAAWSALKGFRVSLQDQTPEKIAPAIKRAHALFTKRLRQPRLVQAAMDRLIPDPPGDGLAKADIVIEAVFEDINVKREVFKEIEPRIRPETILATNTSSIPLDELAMALQHPGRLVALHFFNPVAKMQLLEVSSGKSGSEESLFRAAAFAGRLAKLPVTVRSRPGFLVNRILMPYMLEAVQLIDEGVSRDVIDTAARNFGMPMGPLELADAVGLDICYSVANILSKHLGIEVSGKLGQMVNDGLLGKKTGKGFYEYRKGRPVKKAAGKNEIHNDIEDRLILRLMNEAAKCLSERIVEDEDTLDAGIIFGTGFAPFTGGPIHYMKSLGTDIISEKLDTLASRYGDRFNKDDWFEQQGNNKKE